MRRARGRKGRARRFPVPRPYHTNSLPDLQVFCCAAHGRERTGPDALAVSEKKGTNRKYGLQGSHPERKRGKTRGGDRNMKAVYGDKGIPAPGRARA